MARRTSSRSAAPRRAASRKAPARRPTRRAAPARRTAARAAPATVRVVIQQAPAPVSQGAVSQDALRRARF